MPGPLEGLRVFDLTRILAGPTATQVLADLGADVIKVERPGTGDDVRGWGPPFLKDADGEELLNDSVYFNAANRNKRSVTINLATPEGQGLARRMIAQCDILFENYKTGALAKYGLAYDDLKDEFPGLIYCSLTGFGHTGPYAPRSGIDLVIQATGGIMSITGPESQEPCKVGVGVADLMCGLYCNVGILAALRHRERTGEGQHLDMALLDSQVAWLVNEGMNYLHTGESPKAWGSAHVSIVPYQAFPASDGSFILAVGTDRQFVAFAQFAGAPELADDPRFTTNALRVRNRAACVEAVSALTRERPRSHWLDGLPPLGVPVAPVNSIGETFDDPQVRSRDMVVEIPHSATGKPEPYIASPLKLSNTPPEYTRPAPTVGEHTDEVLGELLGLDEAAVAELRCKGVV